jgi:ubiquinone/menaquinone biosynthesis C-methylase UbiE
MRQPSLNDVYQHRFSDDDLARKDALWREIGLYLQRYVPSTGIVLDLACDRGHFIRNIRAREKWATDLRNVSSHLPHDVRFVQAPGLELDRHLPNEHFDVVFVSNYLEHLPDGEAVVEQLRVACRLLQPSGRVIVLQPNIRLIGDAYWDFIDHSVALTEKSLVEAGELAGLHTREVVTRFLPYTTKSRLPQSPRLVRAYLRLPLAWRLLGQQTLYIGERVGSHGNEAATHSG